jgi:diaminopimelate decarboxylase
MHEVAYRNTTLMVESTPLRSIAEEYGTPLYVYSKHSVVDHCRHIERAFEGREHRTSYAVKANSNKALLRLIAQEGLGADVGSKGELYLALASGFPPHKITYSGVGKRDDEILYGLEKGIHAFNVESPEELQILNDIATRVRKTARVLLRVNLDISAGGHAYVSTSLRQNKFGINHTQVLEALQLSQSLPFIELRGLHSHIGSQIVKADTFRDAAFSLRALVQTVRASGYPVHDLDFGGGFGVQYRGFIEHADLPPEDPEVMNLSAATLVRTVIPLLEETGCRISIQPGRSIIAHAGVLLVKVIYRKSTPEKIFIVTDGGMNDLLRPSLYDAHHQIIPLELRGEPFETVDVVGPLCESGDFLAMHRLLPRSVRGDYLAVMCAGAYGYVLSSNYNARPRPAEVLVDGEVCTVIRERETIEQL